MKEDLTEAEEKNCKDLESKPMDLIQSYNRRTVNYETTVFT